MWLQNRYGTRPTPNCIPRPASPPAPPISQRRTSATTAQLRRTIPCLQLQPHTFGPPTPSRASQCLPYQPTPCTTLQHYPALHCCLRQVRPCLRLWLIQAAYLFIVVKIQKASAMWLQHGHVIEIETVDETVNHQGVAWNRKMFHGYKGDWLKRECFRATLR